jgi:ribosomal protein S18 acetylase RimI-like enzyme
MLTIRNISPEDAKTVDQIYYRNWLTVYPNEVLGITREDIHEIYKDIETESEIMRMQNLIRSLPKKVKYLVAESDGNVVGLCRSIVFDDFNELQAMYVMPEFQGQGIGKKLWEASLKFYNPANQTIVHVADYNTKAIDFYKSLGFIETGEQSANKAHQMPISKVIIPEIKMKLAQGKFITSH